MTQQNMQKCIRSQTRDEHLHNCHQILPHQPHSPPTGTLLEAPTTCAKNKQQTIPQHHITLRTVPCTVLAQEYDQNAAATTLERTRDKLHSTGPHLAPYTDLDLLIPLYHHYHHYHLCGINVLSDCLFRR